MQHIEAMEHRTRGSLAAGRESPWTRWERWAAKASICLLLAAGTSAWAAGSAHVAAQIRLPLGVLGDSDSHSYQDALSFPRGGALRGGTYRQGTLQWTEVLARIRGDYVDPGPWGIWGTRGTVAELQEWLGRDGRAPQKQDFRYNFAYSGAECAQLTEGRWRQTQRLLALMDRDSALWRRGVIVIRIGINSFGRGSDLERLARNREDATVRSEIGQCVDQIARAVGLIRKGHPETFIVLVGIFDDSNIPEHFGQWQAAVERANIKAGLDVFDNALRSMARADRRAAFFDDRQFFRELWGGRSRLGRPDYRSVPIDADRAVTNTQGDHPRNAVLADNHAGVVWNALWAAALVRLLDARAGTSIPQITRREIAQLVEPIWPSTAR